VHQRSLTCLQYLVKKITNTSRSLEKSVKNYGIGIKVFSRPLFFRPMFRVVSFLWELNGDADAFKRFTLPSFTISMANAVSAMYRMRVFVFVLCH
jgi:hypothetical protein